MYTDLFVEIISTEEQLLKAKTKRWINRHCCYDYYSVQQGKLLYYKN